MSNSRPFTLVLSGGGLKGLAHIGVFQALDEIGVLPHAVIGTSMGSLVAAAWAAVAAVISATGLMHGYQIADGAVVKSEAKRS